MTDKQIEKSHGKWHGGKGSARKQSNQQKYADNWEKIFGKKKPDVKARKVTPDQGSTKVHKDKTKYDRLTYKQTLAKQRDLNWDGNE